jgi:hypothetical protein
MENLDQTNAEYISKEEYYAYKDALRQRNIRLMEAARLDIIREKRGKYYDSYYCDRRP